MLTQEPRYKPGRNDLCACGSGRKSKKCCGGRAAGKAQEPINLPQLSLLLQQGNFTQLETAARSFLIGQPKNGTAWKLLAVALHRKGKDAFEALEKAATLFPDDAEAQGNLGNALRRRGRLQEAVACQMRALAINPGYAQAHNDLGALRGELGQLTEAIDCYRKAVALKPGFALASLNLGRALLQAGEAEEAAAWLRSATDLEPDSTAAHWLLGNALMAMGRNEEAVVHYQRAIGLKADFAMAYSNLGCALRDLGRLDEAALNLQRAAELLPGQSEIHNNLGIVQRLLHRYPEAATSAAMAHELNPQSAAPLIALARLKADRGGFTEAEEMLRRALALDPDSAEAWSAIAALRTMTSDDADWLANAHRLSVLGVPPRQEAHLHYAMGKYCDDIGDFRQAFGHFRRANDLRKSHSPNYERGEFHDFITRLIHSRTARCANAHGPGPQPVFIVGMPRSGTSLAEQILASHPLIHGAGELAFWSQALVGWADAPGERENEGLERLGLEYRRLIGLSADGKANVVDKMPANFLSLGLIHAALPGVRIIHMRRDPLDTCLSIYFQNFEATYNYAHDLEDLAHYYEQYSRLMQHWREVLPRESLLEVSYEELVAAPESQSRRMLEFVGVDWDPQCLEFHRTQRTVITASRWQVRQRINSRSVERWRNYAAHLGPLRRLQRNA